MPQDLNLGPKPLSLIEFETWRLRPLGHHDQFSIAFIPIPKNRNCPPNVFQVYCLHFVKKIQVIKKYFVNVIEMFEAIIESKPFVKALLYMSKFQCTTLDISLQNACSIADYL